MSGVHAVIIAPVVKKIRRPPSFRMRCASAASDEDPTRGSRRTPKTARSKLSRSNGTFSTLPGRARTGGHAPAASARRRRAGPASPPTGRNPARCNQPQSAPDRSRARRCPHPAKAVRSPSSDSATSTCPSEAGLPANLSALRGGSRAQHTPRGSLDSRTAQSPSPRWGLRAHDDSLAKVSPEIQRHYMPTLASAAAASRALIQSVLQRLGHALRRRDRHHRRYPRRLLGSGGAAAPERESLALLPSGPDAVRTLPVRGTRSSTPRAQTLSRRTVPRTAFGPAWSGFRVQGTADSPPSAAERAEGTTSPRDYDRSRP